MGGGGNCFNMNRSTVCKLTLVYLFQCSLIKCKVKSGYLHDNPCGFPLEHFTRILQLSTSFQEAFSVVLLCNIRNSAYKIPLCVYWKELLLETSYIETFSFCKIYHLEIFFYKNPIRKIRSEIGSLQCILSLVVQDMAF